MDYTIVSALVALCEKYGVTAHTISCDYFAWIVRNKVELSSAAAEPSFENLRTFERQALAKRRRRPAAAASAVDC